MRSDILPGFSTILRHMDQTIICSCPDCVDVFWRSSYCVDHASTWLRCHLRPTKHSDTFWYLRFFAREVWTDDVPTHSAIGCLKQHVASQIKYTMINGRKENWSCSEEAILT